MMIFSFTILSLIIGELCLAEAKQISFVAKHGEIIALPKPDSFIRSLTLTHIFHHQISSKSSLPTKLPNSKLFSGSKNVVFARADISAVDLEYLQSSDTQALSMQKLDVMALFKSNRPAYVKPARSINGIRRFRRKVEESDQIVPNPNDKWTTLSMAWMSYNSYNLPSNSSSWFPVPGYQLNVSYGFESDALRGYVYASENHDLLVISVKGTSAQVFGVGGGPTATKDKYHDNLMFSCCCAAIDRTWWTICPCAKADQKTCDMKCLSDVLQQPDSYFAIALKIHEQLRLLYPQATIWWTGHSLGGAVAAVAALETHASAITFEAPGDLLYATRLGFQFPEGVELPIWHLGVWTDPIFRGQCAATVTSACYISGYALETRCHVGRTCYLDKEKDENGNDVGMDIRNHQMMHVLDMIKTRSDPMDLYCTSDMSTCHDCSNWTFLSK